VSDDARRNGANGLPDRSRRASRRGPPGEAPDDLKRLPILAELAEADRDAVSEELEEVWAEPGARLFDEGEEDGSLWLLLEGRVRVASARCGCRAELAAPAALGALALAGGPRRARVETASRCRLLRLAREAFRRLAASDPPVAQRLLEAVACEGARQAEAALRAGVDPAALDD
jgi:CRP-like cAMP-binding protein